MYDCACVQHQLLPRGIGLHWFHPVQRPGLKSLLCFFPWLIFLEVGSLQGYDAVLFGSVRKRVLQSLNRFHLSSPRRHWHGPSCHYHVFYVFKVDWTSFMKESCLPDLVSSVSFVVSDSATPWPCRVASVSSRDDASTTLALALSYRTQLPFSVQR